LILICARSSGRRSFRTTCRLQCRARSFCSAKALEQPAVERAAIPGRVGGLHQPHPRIRSALLAEGDSAALREAKRLVKQLDARVEEVSSAKLGVTRGCLRRGLFTPLMEASLLACGKLDAEDQRDEV